MLTQDYKLIDYKCKFFLQVYKCFSLLCVLLVLCILRTLEIIQTKTEGQTSSTENLTVKLQNSNRNSRLSWVSLIGL